MALLFANLHVVHNTIFLDIICILILCDEWCTLGVGKGEYVVCPRFTSKDIVEPLNKGHYGPMSWSLVERLQCTTISAWGRVAVEVYK